MPAFLTTPGGDVMAYTFIRDVTDEKTGEKAMESVIDEETDFVFPVNTVSRQCRLLRFRSDYNELKWKRDSMFDFDRLAGEENMAPISSEDKDALKKLLNFDELTACLKDQPFASATDRTQRRSLSSP